MHHCYLVATGSSPMIIGVSFHFCQIFEIKYAAKNVTIRKDKLKNTLSNKEIVFVPIYLKPCRVELSRYSCIFSQLDDVDLLFFALNCPIDFFFPCILPATLENLM